MLEKNRTSPYNGTMSQAPSCSTNRWARRIRIIVSLGIIGAGIYYKNWIGLLGIVTLISALTGSCPFSLRLGSSRGDQPPDGD